MKVVVCGDRYWPGTKTWPISTRLAQLPPGTTVIHGACRGADTIAGKIAGALGFTVDPHPAAWTQFGDQAGPIRNREMLDLRPDLLLAFHPDLAHSKGTAGIIKEARRRGIPVEVITGHE